MSKRYRVADREHYYTMRDAIVKAVTAPARAVRSLFGGGRRAAAAGGGDGTGMHDFWALRDVAFELHQGEVLGIIGRNGAGKSTLLKILSRITEPTTGYADIYGRVGSLLEVGTGFHQELSGRENIYMSGALLGMNRAEINRKFDEIVAFSEVEEFIDTPVKRYSSGMYTRLAFAVAAHLEPEILIVDEVLAVGDASFQRKCLGKMGEVARHGRTVLFVSHNMAAVQSLCTKALMLSAGRVQEVGLVEPVVQKYLKMAGELEATPLDERKDRKGDGSARLTAMKIEDADGGMICCGSRLRVTLDYEAEGDRPLRNPRFLVAVHDLTNTGIFLLDTDAGGGLPDTLPARGRVTCVTDAIRITPGRCYVNVALHKLGGISDQVETAAYFDVESENLYGQGRIPERQVVMCVIDQQWSVNGVAAGRPPAGTAGDTVARVIAKAV
ncbi:MAG TPA: ABC transporter ATP-binding protein [Tepidisphaeraceae bacterium]|nr:ABC transporter ATP-binding protein [Tepidisphaeraceae bacterium]